MKNQVDTHIESFVERLQIINEMMPIHEYIRKYRLNSKTRERNVTVHRQYLMWKIHRKTSFAKVSLTHIGKLFNRDHATVIHALKCVNAMRETNDRFLKEVITVYGDEINGLDYENI